MSAEDAASNKLVVGKALTGKQYRLGDTSEETFVIPVVSPSLQASQAIGDPADQVAYVVHPLLAHALTSEGHDASEDGTGRGTPLIAAPLSHGSNPNSNMAGRRREDDENLVTAFYPTGGSRDGFWSEQISPPMKVGTGVGAPAGLGIVQTTGVRRLTPVECERLQALPDGWTDLGGTPDSRRYAALGDAVTASVAEWIGRRLLSAALTTHLEGKP